MSKLFKTINKSSLSALSVIILLFLAWGIYKIIDRLIHPPLYVIIQFDDLGPIYKKMPVYYKGYKIGKTQKIEPSKDYKSTLVTIDFYPKDLKLPENITAKVKKLDTGIDYIDILYPKNPSEEFIKTGEIIQGNTALDIQSFMNAQVESGTLNTVINDASNTLESITKTSNEGKKVLSSLNLAINENRTNIKFVTYNLSLTSKNLSAASKNLSNMTSDINNALSPEMLNNTTSDIEETARNIKILSENLNKTIDSVNATMCELNGSAKNIKNITSDVKKSIDKRKGLMGIILGGK